MNVYFRTSLLSIVLALIICNSINAQVPYSVQAKVSIHSAASKEHISFWKSTTLVVLGGNEDYNEEIKTAVKEHWDITPYKFISIEEYEQYKYDKQYSFILPIEYTVTPQQGRIVNFSFLALAMGSKKAKRNLRGRFLSVALIDNMAVPKIYPREYNTADYLYRMEHMIIFLKNAVSIVQKENISTNNPLKVRDLLFKYYSKKAKSIKSKTLLIEESIYKNNIDKESFKNAYKNKYKVVSKEQLAEAIKSKDEKYCYLITFRDPTLIYFIVSAEDAEILYVDTTGTRGKPIGKKSMKRLIKKIEEGN